MCSALNVLLERDSTGSHTHRPPPHFPTPVPSPAGPAVVQRTVNLLNQGIGPLFDPEPNKTVSDYCVSVKLEKLFSALGFLKWQEDGMPAEVSGRAHLLLQCVRP